MQACQKLRGFQPLRSVTNTGSRSMILNVGLVELVLTILIAVMPPSSIVLPECEALAATKRRW